MNLAYKKILGKFTKVLGFGKTPPHVGKNSQIILFFSENLPNKDHQVGQLTNLCNVQYASKNGKVDEEGCELRLRRLF